MLRHLHKIICVLFILCLLLFVATPVYAIVNPDDIDFGTGTETYYKVFYNVLEAGDWLVIAEGWVNYIVPPTDYTAEQAFLFELLNTTDTATYASTPLQSYGDRPISIYLTAAQVTTLGLTVGTAYGVRITGNPLIFVSPTGNTVTAHFSVNDYVDQLLGVDGGVASANPLRNGMIQMANTIEDYDTPVDPYITEVQGVSYLTLDGGDIFIEGIPNLTNMCPVLFQAGLKTLEDDTPDMQGSYAQNLNPLQQWGSTVANGLTMLGSYMGISQQMAGSVVLLGLGVALAVYVYQRTQSGIALLLIIGVIPYLGAWLGLMPLALAFIFTIVIVVLLMFFFFSRGAL